MEGSGPPGLDVAALLSRLAAEREALLGGSAASAGQRAPVELDQTSVGRLSRMDAIQQQAMAQAAERRRAVALQRIDAALARAGRGEYGWCVQCGEAIAAARLELDPSAPSCIACAGAREGR